VGADLDGGRASTMKQRVEGWPAAKIFLPARKLKDAGDGEDSSISAGRAFEDRHRCG
jgi:hypothetical protein